MMVLLLFYLIFAILGTQMFKGEFHRCEAKDAEGDYLYPDAMPLTKFALNQTQCTCDGCEWVTPFLNFDNVGSSMLTLFAVSTTDQWMEVLYNALDATSHELVRMRPRCPLEPIRTVRVSTREIFPIKGTLAEPLLDADGKPPDGLARGCHVAQS
jgi:hypothetical protein